MPLITLPPTSQKSADRPISFHLDDVGKIRSLFLVVRPEDLTRTDISRMSLQQTLSADNQGWVDNFGVGLPTISISGHTGWRDMAGSGDGEQQFRLLNEMVMVDWHAARARQIKAGQDPDRVKLIFVDKLDSFAYVVVPQTFVLRRSKSRPLLMQYQISMQAISDSVDPNLGSPMSASASALAGLGLDSLGDALGAISDFATGVANFITGTVGAVAKKFLSMTRAVLGVVMRVVGTIKGAIDKVAGAFLGVARDIMGAGRNLFMAVSAVMSLPAYAKYRFMQVCSAFNAAYCVLKNVFKVRKTYPDYSDWYGASTCSSTAGGSPLSPLRGDNAFYLLRAQETSTTRIAMTAPAAAATRSAAAMDPVLAPSNLALSTQSMRDMSAIQAFA